MSIRAFDLALAARRNPELAVTLTDLGPFLDMCRHAQERQAFAPKSLTWSASREPLGLTILHEGEPIWTVLRAEKPTQWVVASEGGSLRLSKADALVELAKVLAATATMMDGVRFEWRRDATIGGSF
jgi:hypothetical protein